MGLMGQQITSWKFHVVYASRKKIRTSAQMFKAYKIFGSVY